MISFVENVDIQAYRNSFNKLDHELRPKCTEYFQPFEVKEKLYLVMLCSFLDIVLYKYRPIYTIPWKFAKSSKGIENNFPHTHQDVIILPYNFYNSTFFNLLRTITHEKIHVFQRYNPTSTLKLYLNFWKMKVYDYSFDENQRSNPDTNHIQYSYYHPQLKTMVLNVQVYKENASNISDSYTKIQHSKELQPNSSRIYYDLLMDNPTYQKEHPNEVMACLLVDMLFAKKRHEPTEHYLFKHF